MMGDDAMATLKKWTHPQYYMGETYYDYYVVLSHHRDGDDLEESNFQSALGMLGGESETVIVARASHWAVGWVELLLVHESDTDAIETAQDILNRLEDYPVLDEEDYSQRESDHALEVWASCYSLKERIALCVECGLSIFAARHTDYLPDTDGRLQDRMLG